MENTQQVRRRQRKRYWSDVELIFFGLMVLLALIMTLGKVVDLAVALSETDQTEQTQTVGGDGLGEGEDTQEAADGADALQQPQDLQQPETDAVDLAQFADDTGYGGLLYQQLDAHPEAAYILRNLDLYPEDLLAFVTRFPEAIPYGAAYLDYDRMGIQLSRDLSQESSRHTPVSSEVQSILDSQGVMPLLLQWDSRWGYETYGDGMLGCTGCGPTCLSMVSLALTGWHENDPYSVAQYAQENGYYVSGSGSSWSLMGEGCAQFGLTSEELPLDENAVIDALEEGKLVICAMGPGDFTDNGHYIILAKYADGAFTIRDPNSPVNSMRTWTFGEIQDQIKNLWSFSQGEN